MKQLHLPFLGFLPWAFAFSPLQAHTVPAVFAESFGLDPLTTGLPEADPDGDGVSNLLEYLHGGDPTVPSASLFPAVSVFPNGGGSDLVLRYRRHLASSPLVTQIVEHTGDLSQPWTPALAGQNGVTWEKMPLDAATEVVTVTIPVADGRHFVRLRASLADLPAAPEGLVLIPAGEFAMGDSLDTDTGAPVRTVYLSAYYLGKTEVTFAEWEEVKTWAYARGYTDLSVGSYKNTGHPLNSISWNDMAKWCNAASEKAGLTPCYTLDGDVYRTGFADPVLNREADGIRLPTEAEWEKGARGGLTGRRFGWGNTISHSQANYNSSSSYSYDISPTRGDHPLYNTGSQPYTSPVGSFAANGYGLFDMSGNVWEFCSDWNAAYPSGKQMNPVGPATGTARVMRGGRAGFNAAGCRVAARNNLSPGVPSVSVGFRIARTVVP